MLPTSGTVKTDNDPRSRLLGRTSRLSSPVKVVYRGFRVCSEMDVGQDQERLGPCLPRSSGPFERRTRGGPGRSMRDRQGQTILSPKKVKDVVFTRTKERRVGRRDQRRRRARLLPIDLQCPLTRRTSLSSSCPGGSVHPDVPSVVWNVLGLKRQNKTVPLAQT